MRSRIVDFLQRRLMVLAITVALFSFAALFARWHWLADLASHFVPHYAVIAGFSAIGLWWRGHHRWAVFAALVFAVQFVQFAPYLPTMRSPQAAVSTFKVFQFNVGQRDGTYSVLPSWLEDRAAEFDVVILFEVDEGWRVPLERVARQFQVSALELSNGSIGMALFSRLPNAKARIERLGPLQLLSGIIAVPVNGERPPLKIIASHPPPPISAPRWKDRNQQFAALAEIATPHGEEVVLVADLNSTVWSPFYGELKRRTGLRDAQAGHLYRATWAPYVLPLAFGIPIDHLMISGGLTSLAREFPPRMYSDHRPIVTTLAVPSTAGSV